MYIQTLKFILVFSFIFFLAAGCSKETKPPQNPTACPQIYAEVKIALKDSSFDPSSLNIKKCTKVVFQNLGEKEHWPASDLHPTHGIYPEFDPQKPIAPNAEWSFVFEKNGSWKFHDHLNAQIRGIITVEN